MHNNVKFKSTNYLNIKTLKALNKFVFLGVFAIYYIKYFSIVWGWFYSNQNIVATILKIKICKSVSMFNLLIQTLLVVNYKIKKMII